MQQRPRSHHQCGPRGSPAAYRDASCAGVPATAGTAAATPCSSLAACSAQGTGSAAGTAAQLPAAAAACLTCPAALPGSCCRPLPFQVCWPLPAGCKAVPLHPAPATPTCPLLLGTTIHGHCSLAYTTLPTSLLQLPFTCWPVVCLLCSLPCLLPPCLPLLPTASFWCRLPRPLAYSPFDV